MAARRPARASTSPGWSLLHRFFQDIANGLRAARAARLLPSRRRASRRYAEAVSGHAVADLDWYVVYAALRHGIVMSQVKRRMIHFGEETVPEDPDDYVDAPGAMLETG